MVHILFIQGMEMFPLARKGFITAPWPQELINRNKIRWRKGNIYHLTTQAATHTKFLEYEILNRDHPHVMTEIPTGQEKGKNQITFERLKGRVTGFIRKKLVPFLRLHHDVYVKDSEGGGGSNLFRIYMNEKGDIRAQTSNQKMAHALGQMEMHFQLCKAFRVSKDVRDLLMRRTVDAVDHATFLPENDAEREYQIGKGSLLLPDVQKALALLLANFMVDPEEGRQYLIAEKALGGLTLPSGKPVEFRFFVQQNRRGNYEVVHHYAKISDNPLAANIAQGGKIVQTDDALKKLLDHHFPDRSEEEKKKMAEEFVDQQKEKIEAYMNHHPLYRQKTYVVKTEEQNQFGVYTNPILSTVDVQMITSEKGIDSTFVEHHGEGNFGLEEDAAEGHIPPD